MTDPSCFKGLTVCSMLSVCEIKSTSTQHGMFACEWEPRRDRHITYLLCKIALALSAANKPIVSC